MGKYSTRSINKANPLFIEHVLYFLLSHEKWTTFVFSRKTKSHMTWLPYNMHIAVKTTARVRYWLIPIYVSQWKSLCRMWEECYFWSSHDFMDFTTMVIIWCTEVNDGSWRLTSYYPWSLDLFVHLPFQLPGEHTALQPCGASDLSYNNFHLCPIRYSFTPEWSAALEGEVPCPRTQHWKHNVPVLRGEKHDIPLKILHLARFELEQQAATLSKLRALAIAPRPSLAMLI